MKMEEGSRRRKDFHSTRAVFFLKEVAQVVWSQTDN